MLAEEAIRTIPCSKQFVVVIFLTFLWRLVAIFDVSAGGVGRAKRMTSPSEDGSLKDYMTHGTRRKRLVCL
jgi:hypothetical protein